MNLFSNAIPKSGSTLIANFQEQFLDSLPGDNGQAILRDLFGGRFLGQITLPIVHTLQVINQRRGSVVIKCHWPPYRELIDFCGKSDTRMTLAYRDPRDVILSMIDHGERTRKGLDQSGALADCRNVRQMIPYVVNKLKEYLVWKDLPFVHCIRYEDLMEDRLATLEKMNDFLGWNVDRGIVRRFMDKAEASKHESWNFNKGTTERWRAELTDDEKAMCGSAFGNYLTMMDYPLE